MVTGPYREVVGVACYQVFYDRGVGRRTVFVRVDNPLVLSASGAIVHFITGNQRVIKNGLPLEADIGTPSKSGNSKERQPKEGRDDRSD